MPDELTHNEIAEQLLRSKAIDFEAVAKFVADLGPDLVTRDPGLHGVVIGRPSVIACMLTAHDLNAVVGALGRVAQVNRVLEAEHGA